MQHNGKSGLKGWLRTTWFPVTNRIPDVQREEFLSQFVEAILKISPMCSKGKTHVQMVRLEVEAYAL